MTIQVGHDTAESESETTDGQHGGADDDRPVSGCITSAQTTVAPEYSRIAAD